MDYVKTRQDLAKVLTTDVLPESDFEHIEPNKNGVTAIDDYIHEIFGLTDEENNYIKNFANVYRVSGGATNESN